MNLRPAFHSKGVPSAVTLVAALATFGACSVDTDGIKFVPDDEFHATGGSGNGRGGSSGKGEAGSDGGEERPCEPGERRCTEEGLLQVCKDGDPPKWETDKDCKGAGRCSASRNTCLDCAPGEFRCRGAVLEQCDMAGERFEAVQTCEDEEACSAKGQVGFCKVCEPGETFCNGSFTLLTGDGSDDSIIVNQVRTCVASGAYTELNASCQGNEPFCNLPKKSCGSCQPGEFQCIGADLYYCNADGNIEYRERCDSRAACRPDEGKCDNSDVECSPNVDGPRCSPTGDLMTCGMNGRWVTEKSCGIDRCRDGYSDCLPCNIDQRYSCNGNTIMGCVPTPWDEWFAYATLFTCATNSCDDGEDLCPNGACLHGTVRCEPGAVYYETCEDGSPQYVGCPGNQVCYGAACVNCYPGSYSCDNGKLMQCSNDGSGKSLVEDCSTRGLACNARLGTCGPFEGPGYYYCTKEGHHAYFDLWGREIIEEYCSKGDICEPNFGCLKYTAGCADGAIACDGRRERVCQTGYYERTNETCASNALCQPGMGCSVPIAISAGDSHTCALLSNPDEPAGTGFVVCWGDNSYGQLGNGASAENGGFGDSVDPQRVTLFFSDDDDDSLSASVAAFTHISAGRDFTCADAQNPAGGGQSWVICWGSNEFGQLGTNTKVPGPFNGSPSPFFVSANAPGENPPLDLRHVTAGAQFACALDPLGVAWCWGRNDAGQLGIDTDDEYRPYASQVAGDHRFVAIAAGARHACAVDDKDAVWCWGSNEFGQLGLGDVKMVRVPTKVGDLEARTDAESLLIGGRDFTAVLRAQGKAPLSWGANLFGQLGDGGKVEREKPGEASSVGRRQPVALYSSSTARHQCLRDKDHKLYCVGANVFGQLGNSSTLDATDPVVVWDGSSPNRRVAQVRDAVAVGGRHTCAINEANEVWCWGANHRHQLGSTKNTPQTAPLKVF